jgi:hypothetical protein
MVSSAPKAYSPNSNANANYATWLANQLSRHDAIKTNVRHRHGSQLSPSASCWAAMCSLDSIGTAGQTRTGASEHHSVGSVHSAASAIRLTCLIVGLLKTAYVQPDPPTHRSARVLHGSLRTMHSCRQQGAANALCFAKARSRRVEVGNSRAGESMQQAHAACCQWGLSPPKPHQPLTRYTPPHPGACSCHGGLVQPRDLERGIRPQLVDG